MGTLSWTLTILALNGALMGALLAISGRHQMANRFLAALVILISIRLVIYILGFAGAYDNHKWLTFAPLDASLAFGPLLWLYMQTLTRAYPQPNWRLHLVPAAIQLAYSCVGFALPLDAKLWWFRGPHLDWVEPLGVLALLASCMTYLTLSWRRQRAYQRWLDDRFADREPWRLGWMTVILAAFALTTAAAVVTALVNAIVTPIDYFGRTTVVVASSLLAYALGLLGWRHGALDVPPQPLNEEEVLVVEPRPSRAAALFTAWSRRIEVEGWWREEGLTLSEVSKRLATSERTLSRALKDATGCNFNEYINRLRVEAVTRMIAANAPGDLLAIALECGFSSKASFNRAFLRHTGMTPSRWRASMSQIPPIKAAGAT